MLIDITVVIPLYNKVSYIDACIKSVLLQSVSPFEIIVIDDGSTDSGHEVVDKIND